MRNRPPETRVELVALLLQLQKELAANESEILVAHADPALDPRLLLLEELKEATNLVRAKLCKLGGKSKTMPQKLARNAALTLVNVAHRCRPFIKARSILVLELPTVFSRLGEPYENEEPDPVRDDIELIAIRSAGGLIRACLLHQNRGAVLQMLTALGCPMQGLINRWGRAAGLTRDFTDPEPSMALASSQPPAGAALPVNDSAPPRTGSEHRGGSEPVQSTTPADVALPVHDIAPRPDDTLTHLEADMLHQQLLRVSNPDGAAASTVPGSTGMQCGELRDAGGGRLVFRGGGGLPPIPDDLDSLDVDLEHLVRPTVTPNPGDPTYSDLMHQLTAKDRSNQRVRFSAEPDQYFPTYHAKDYIRGEAIGGASGLYFEDEEAGERKAFDDTEGEDAMIPDVGEAADKAAKEVSEAAEKAAKEVSEAAEKAAKEVSEAAGKVWGSMTSLF